MDYGNHGDLRQPLTFKTCHSDLLYSSFHACLASLYFFKTINDEEIIEKVKKQLLYDAIPFVVFFLLFTGLLMLKDGFAVNPATGEVFMQPFKYFHNLIEMPVVAILFLVGVVTGISRNYLTGCFFVKYGEKGIWFVRIRNSSDSILDYSCWQVLIILPTILRLQIYRVH